MKTTTKLVTTIVVIFAIAAAALALQAWGGRLTGTNISAAEMEAFVETLGPQFAGRLQTPEQKKEFANSVKEVLALGQEAERLGYDRKDPRTATQLELQKLIVLRDAYERNAQSKGQPAQFSDEELKTYEQAHPNAFDTFLGELAKVDPRAQQMPAEQKDRLKKDYYMLLLSSEKAKAEKLDQAPGVQLRMKVDRANVLASQYVKELQEQVKASEQEVQQYYDQHKQEYEQVRARHILVSTRPEPNEKGETKPIDQAAARKKAEDLLTQAQAGKDFATLAKENTDEPAGKETGGDLGFFTKDKMVPSFSEAAFALQPGQLSGVVESPFGFHVIKVEERRPAPMEEIKPEIEDKLRQGKFKQQLDAIVAKSGITVAEDFNVKETGGVQSLPGLPPGHP